MDRLRAERLLNDSEVAGAVMRLAERRGLGSRRVVQQLKRRGIGEDDAVDAIGDARIGDLERALALMGRRYPEGVADDRRLQARVARFLLGRGFPTDVAFAALKASKKLTFEA